MTALNLKAEASAVAEQNPRAADEMVRRVAGNSVWLIAQPLLLNVISILSTGYIARKLGAADYGAFNLGFAQISFFLPISNLGLSGVAIRAIAQNRDRAEEVTATIFATRLLTTAFAVLLAFLWLMLPTYSLTTRVIGMAALLSMVCQACGSICLSLFQGFERSKLTAQPQIVGGLVLTLLSVLALLLGLGLPGFVAAYVLGAAFQLWLLMRTARRHFFPVRPRWNWAGIKDYLRQTRAFALIDVMSRATEASVPDVMILGALYASGVVGPYAAAIGLVSRLAIIPWGLVDALYPAVAHHADDAGGVRRALRRSLLYLVMATLPVALCLSVTAPTVLWILFGGEYLSATTALQVAAWMLPVAGASYLIRVSLAAVHHQDVVARLILVRGAVTVGLFALLIPRYGPLGAALGLVLRDSVMLLLWCPPYLHRFGQAIPWADLGRATVALAVMAAPLGLLLAHYSHPGAILAAVTSFALYGAALHLMGLVDVGALARRLPGMAGR